MPAKEYDWSVLKHKRWLQPILITEDNVVVDGAHRVVAAREMGVKLAAIRLPFLIEEVDPNLLDTWLDHLASES